MQHLTVMNCPTCGASLDIQDGQGQISSCSYCGTKIILETKIGEKSQRNIKPEEDRRNDISVGSGAVVVIGDKTSGIANMEECPVCGKLNKQEDTFRCKRCQRPYICLKHQDPTRLICSECIQEISSKVAVRPAPVYQMQQQVADSKSGWAIASLVLGIIGIMSSLVMPLICVPINLIGLVAGIIGKKSSNSGIAISGIVSNVLGIMLHILFVILGVGLAILQSLYSP